MSDRSRTPASSCLEKTAEHRIALVVAVGSPSASIQNLSLKPKMLRTTASGCAALMLMLAVGDAEGSWKAIVMGVDDYSSGTCDAPDLDEAVDSAEAFDDYIDNRSDISQSVIRRNGEVRDNYLKDDDWSGDGQDESHTYGFDHEDNLVRFFSGHGSCGPYGRQGGGDGNPPPAGNCDEEADPLAYCATNNPAPVGGEYGSLTCRDNPQTGQSDHTRGVCRYHYDHAPVTCSTADNPDLNLVYYSSGVGGQKMRLDTEGAAFLEISCPVHVDQAISGLGALLSGVTVVGTKHVVAGDTAVTQACGDELGLFAQAGTWDSAGATWLNSIWSIIPGNGCDHPTGVGEIISGGVNGCGGHLTMATGNTLANAWDRIDREWSELDDTSGSGTNWYVWIYNCNYDCFSNPPFFE